MRSVIHSYLSMFALMTAACSQELAPSDAPAEPPEAGADERVRKADSLDNPGARRALERVRQSLSHSTTGLRLERHTAHSSRIDLDGRFGTATVVVRSADGRLQRRCIDEPEQLDRMLGATP